MNSQQISQMMQDFQSNGGKVKQCVTGDTSIHVLPRGLLSCECGCHGNYTEHSMRAGESGRDSSVIIG